MSTGLPFVMLFEAELVTVRDLVCLGFAVVSLHIYIEVPQRIPEVVNSRVVRIQILVFTRLPGDSGEVERAIRREAEQRSGEAERDLGAQRRWQVDCAGTVRLRQDRRGSNRSEA